MRKTTVFLTVVLAVLGQGLPARAHAERSASTPQEGERVAAAPEELRITFTEPPTGDAVVQVLDGCDRDVVAGVEVQNFDITAGLDPGQPGAWTVQTNVISAVDGHNTRDRWTFRVRGEADCTAPEDDDPGPAADEPDDGGGSSAPLLVFGVAMVAVIGLALVLRGRSS